MSKSSDALIYLYARKHWPSGLSKEMTATADDIEKAAQKAVADLRKNATNTGVVVRLAGQSGSGKTTQLLPAAKAYFEKKKLKPILVAARELMKYHPYYNEILDRYGKAEIRKRTDDFATVMAYRVIRELTKERYDLIIDIAFASTKVEKIFTILTAQYATKIVLMMAVSEEVSEKLLAKRSWRHDRGMEKEFENANGKALKFYGKICPDMRIIMWNFDDLEPIYDGGISGAFTPWANEMNRAASLNNNIEKLVQSKIEYIRKH